MHEKNDTLLAVLKVIFAWICAVIGSLTASQLAIYLTIIFTALNIYVLVRDKIANRKNQEQS